MDYYKKLFKYRTAGVREYWVVDPERQFVTVYNFEKETMDQYSFGDIIKGENEILFNILRRKYNE